MTFPSAEKRKNKNLEEENEQLTDAIEILLKKLEEKNGEEKEAPKILTQDGGNAKDGADHREQDAPRERAEKKEKKERHRDSGREGHRAPGESKRERSRSRDGDKKKKKKKD